MNPPDIFEENTILSTISAWVNFLTAEDVIPRDIRSDFNKIYPFKLNEFIARFYTLMLKNFGAISDQSAVNFRNKIMNTPQRVYHQRGESVKSSGKLSEAQISFHNEASGQVALLSPEQKDLIRKEFENHLRQILSVYYVYYYPHGELDTNDRRFKVLKKRLEIDQIYILLFNKVMLSRFFSTFETKDDYSGNLILLETLLYTKLLIIIRVLYTEIFEP